MVRCHQVDVPAAERIPQRLVGRGPRRQGEQRGVGEVGEGRSVQQGPGQGQRVAARTPERADHEATLAQKREARQVVTSGLRELAFRAIGVDVESQACGGVVDAIEDGDMILAETLVRAHVDALRRVPGVNVVAISSIDRPRAEELADSFGIADVYDDWHDILANGEIQLIAREQSPGRGGAAVIVIVLTPAGAAPRRGPPH